MALFIALGGTAWALQENSVKSKHIKDGQVKEQDLADDSVTHPKVADNAISSDEVIADSLTGVDIQEGSFGDVPGADNADLLDGYNSSDFVRVDDQIPPSFVALGDDVGGGPNTTTLLTSGPFTITGECTDEGATGRQGIVKITSSVGQWSVSSDAPGSAGALDAAAGAVRNIANDTEGVTTGDFFSSGAYAAVVPGAASLVGHVYGGVNLNGIDCVFGVTGEAG